MEKLLSSTNRTLRTFRYGEVVEGTVISVGRKEVFVDLGSKSEGIVGSRELEDEVDSISGLKVGDKVIATVVQTENDQGYTILSLKRAQNERAWREVEEAFKKGKVLLVKVVDFNKGGLVVEYPAPFAAEKGAGLRGFVPFSHLNTTPSPTSHLSSPRPTSPATCPPVPGVGRRGELAGGRATSMLDQTLKVRVIELNRSINRLVFSEKLASLLSDPKIKTFFENLEPEKKMRGTVTSIFPFGAFVRLAEGVEGLVHISEMGWERVGHPEEVVKVGNEVEVVVLSVNKEQGKLALSMKALKENPWKKVVKKYKVGDTVIGKVTKTVPFGAFVKLPEGIEGLIHVSETTGPLAEGEEVQAVIVNLEPEKQKLGLSVKKLKAQSAKIKT